MDKYHIAFAAAWDYGMKHMHEAGRQQWTVEDFAAAEGEFSRIMNEDEDDKDWGLGYNDTIDQDKLPPPPEPSIFSK